MKHEVQVNVPHYLMQAVNSIPAVLLGCLLNILDGVSCELFLILLIDFQKPGREDLVCICHGGSCDLGLCPITGEDGTPVRVFKPSFSGYLFSLFINVMELRDSYHPIGQMA